MEAGFFGGPGGSSYLALSNEAARTVREKRHEINEKFPPLLNSSHNRGGPFKCKQMPFKTLKWHEALQSQSPPPLSLQKKTKN